MQGEGIDRFITGFPAHRMKPIPEKATEGRANPAGIAFLYLASTVETAISEAAHGSAQMFQSPKPASCAKCELSISRKATASLVSLNSQWVKSQALSQSMPETKNRIVWTEIDSASLDLSPEQKIAVDYVPTQILAEAFRQHGFDGIIYRSNFGEPGYNLTLFDLDSVEIINCAPYQIDHIRVEFKEMGNRWVKR